MSTALACLFSYSALGNPYKLTVENENENKNHIGCRRLRTRTRNMIFHSCVSPSRMQRPLYCTLHDINLCWYRCLFHCGISFALKTVYPYCRMSGMGSTLCKAFRVDIAQCELGKDRGCYRQEIGQVEEEGPVFVLNTMDDGSTFCLQRI